MTPFTNKTLLITGGTGSFGNAVLNRFLRTDIGEIRIFSRDEKKQDDMRHEFQTRIPEAAEKIKFYIGDVRDLQSVRGAMHGVDYIFHAAALKQVPSCEFFPMEAMRTNVIGTDNVLTAAIEAGGCISHQCHGHVQGSGGKGCHCKKPDKRQYEDLLHTVRQCHVFPRLGDPAVDRPDPKRAAHHTDGTENDAVHHVVGGGRRSCAVRL